MEAALVESLGEFSFVVVDGEALWCCQYHLCHRLAIALQMRQFSFNMEVKIYCRVPPWFVVG